MLAAVATTTQEGLSRRYREETVAVIEGFLAAGRAAHHIRPDVTADDVLAVVGFLWCLEDEGWEPRVARMLDTVVAGLAAPD